MLRFAPSPNGPLHLGHALSLFVNEGMAEALSKPLILRMEDIDRGRSREAFEIAILDDVAFLGVNWSAPLRRQSDRFHVYSEALDRLRNRGLLYPSFATRKEIANACPAGAQRDPDGSLLFPGDKAVLSEGELARRRKAEAPAVWRLHMARAVAEVGDLSAKTVDAGGRPSATVPVHPAAWGDVVLARKDTPTSYHLSVVVDDAEQDITHVVRGADLLAATAVHRLLQRLLGLPAPSYHHHRLILGDDGRKLSKSNGAESLAAMREQGVSAGEIRQRCGYAAFASSGSPTRSEANGPNATG